MIKMSVLRMMCVGATNEISDIEVYGTGVCFDLYIEHPRGIQPTSKYQQDYDYNYPFCPA